MHSMIIVISWYQEVRKPILDSWINWSDHHIRDRPTHLFPTSVCIEACLGIRLSSLRPKCWYHLNLYLENLSVRTLEIFYFSRIYLFASKINIKMKLILIISITNCKMNELWPCVLIFSAALIFLRYSSIEKISLELTIHQYVNCYEL